MGCFQRADYTLSYPGRGGRGRGEAAGSHSFLSNEEERMGGELLIAD
jgi:hypothetical protein